MTNAKKSAWKTCSRGHKYRGQRCPYCWKRNKAKDPTTANPKAGAGRQAVSS